ncbi:hypothetical protein LTR56_001812 [Elasticomyces elasticus]|nr:hypothetical protein LTR56_001812 [Elasticomyces elasticus]
MAISRRWCGGCWQCQVTGISNVQVLDLSHFDNEHELLRLPAASYAPKLADSEELFRPLMRTDDEVHARAQKHLAMASRSNTGHSGTADQESEIPVSRVEDGHDVKLDRSNSTKRKRKAKFASQTSGAIASLGEPTTQLKSQSNGGEPTVEGEKQRSSRQMWHAAAQKRLWELRDSGMSTKAIAIEMSCSVHGVAQALQRFKPGSRWTAQQEEELLMLRNSGLTMAELSARLNRSTRIINSALHRLGDARGSQGMTWTKADKEMLFRLYQDGVKETGIAAQMNRSAQSVERALWRLSKEGHAITPRRLNYTKAQNEEVAKLHHEGLPHAEIAARIGRPRGAITGLISRLTGLGVLKSRKVPRSWTEAERQQVLRYRESGISLEAMAALTGRMREDIKGTLRVFARGTMEAASAQPSGGDHAAGEYTSPRASAEWTEDERMDMVQLRNSGHTFPDIAYKLGRSLRSVEGVWHMRKLGDVATPTAIHNRPSQPFLHQISKPIRRWKTEELRELFRLRDEGVAEADIAERTQRTPTSVHDALHVYKDFKLARQYQHWNPEETTRLIELRKEGLSRVEIAAQLGRSLAAVGVISRRLDLEKSKLTSSHEKAVSREVQADEHDAQIEHPRRLQSHTIVPTTAARRSTNPLSANARPQSTTPGVNLGTPQSRSYSSDAGSVDSSGPQPSAIGATQKPAAVGQSLAEQSSSSEHSESRLTRRKNRRWSDDERYEVARLRAEGVTQKEIAARLNRPYSSTTHVQATRPGDGSVSAPKPPKRRRWSLEDVTELRRLKDEGLTISMIAHRLMRSSPAIWQVMRKLGISPRMHHKHWTPSDLAQLRSLRNTTLTRDEIAAKMNRSIGSLNHATFEFGLETRVRRKFTSTELRLMHKLRSEGLSLKAIGVHLDRTPTTVLQALRRYPPLED